METVTDFSKKLVLLFMRPPPAKGADHFRLFPTSPTFSDLKFPTVSDRFRPLPTFPTIPTLSDWSEIVGLSRPPILRKKKEDFYFQKLPLNCPLMLRLELILGISGISGMKNYVTCYLTRNITGGNSCPFIISPPPQR